MSSPCNHNVYVKSSSLVDGKMAERSKALRSGSSNFVVRKGVGSNPTLVILRFQRRAFPPQDSAQKSSHIFRNEIQLMDYFMVNYSHALV